MTNLTVPYFDYADVELLDDDSLEHPDAQTALAAFLALTPQDRLADSRHVYAYYQDFHAAVGGEDWLDAEMGIPDAPQDIWNHVTPQIIAIQRDAHNNTGWYVVIEANCDWEQEHGLMLAWRGGAELTKTGNYDGHVTNVNAYGDDGLETVVYAATDPDFTTHLDE